jgi:hypothetical protein
MEFWDWVSFLVVRDLDMRDLDMRCENLEWGTLNSLAHQIS